MLVQSCKERQWFSIEEPQPALAFKSIVGDLNASFKRPSMKTGARLIKDEEKVDDLSSYAVNTIKASFPPTSNIGVQTFFSNSFSNRRDKKGVVNVKKDQLECLRMRISLHISKAVLNLLLATQRS